MTLEEFAVERIKELECKKVELEAALKAKSDEYKVANTSIKKLREENDRLKEIIGRYTDEENSNLKRSGCIYLHMSDSYKGDDSYTRLTEEEKTIRQDFDLVCKIVKEYRELHPKLTEEGDS